MDKQNVQPIVNIVDDDAAVRDSLSFLLRSVGIQHRTFASAQEYLDARKYEEAVDAYKQAIKVNPDNAVAYYKLGIAYRSAGKMQESVEALKQAIKINSDYAEEDPEEQERHGRGSQDTIQTRSCGRTPSELWEN